MEALRANSGLAFLGRATMDPLRSILPVLQLPQRATATPGACLALPFLQDAILPEQLDQLKPTHREKIKNGSAPSRPVRSRLGGRRAMLHLRHLLVAGLFVGSRNLQSSCLPRVGAGQGALDFFIAVMTHTHTQSSTF